MPLGLDSPVSGPLMVTMGATLPPLPAGYPVMLGGPGGVSGLTPPLTAVHNIDVAARIQRDTDGSIEPGIRAADVAVGAGHTVRAT